MFCVFRTFWNHFNFEEECSFRRTTSQPAIGAWESTGRQGTGDITGRERCDGSSGV